MKTRTILINNEEYTVSSTTEEGLERAIISLTNSIQKINNIKGHGI